MRTLFRATRHATRLVTAGIALLVSSLLYAAIPGSERAVLDALYNNTAGAGWVNSTGWATPADECTWYGITCNAGGSHVIVVKLNSNNLVGSLPAILNQLTALQEFAAGGNVLTGPIPALAGLTALKSFTAANNQLTGAFPSPVGLPSLQVINVFNNQLSGPIPPLSSVSTLRALYASGNLLTGHIPALTGLSALEYFDVGTNLLTGPLPTLSGLSQLQYFVAYDNRLTGGIPALSGLPALVNLNVRLNQLTGAIPSLAALPALEYALFDYNQLSGALPNAPATLVAGASTLCPNQFSVSVIGAWDMATGSTPWSADCVAALPQLQLAFGVAPALVIGGAGGPVTVVFTPMAGSANSVKFSSLTPLVCSVAADLSGETAVDTGVVTLVAGATAGNICTIAADKKGDASINSAVQVQQSMTLLANANCRLDINGDQLLGPHLDGLLILRYLAGLRGPLLTAGMTLSGSRPTADLIEPFLAAQNLDVRGLMPAATASSTRDGLVIMRYLQKLEAAMMVLGTDIPDIKATETIERIAAWCAS